MSLQLVAEDLNPWWEDPARRAPVRFPRRRLLHADVLRRVSDSGDRRAVLVIGPRQVGKTVLLWQVGDDLLDAGLPTGNLTYFDFADARLTEDVSAEDIAALLPPAFQPNRPRVLLLDEIGRATGWDRWLKQIVDRHPEIRVVATDSAAPVLRRGSRESGPGRWDELPLESLSFTEYLRLTAPENLAPREALTRYPHLLPRYLANGGFPEHAGADDLWRVRSRLRADVAERAILRDLVREGVDVERALRLFVYLAGDSGAIFDATSRASELGADARTVREYARLLTDTMLIVRLEKWARRGTARLRGHPRLYAADHGLIGAFRATSRESDGAVAETVAFRHLRALARERGAEIRYFRRDEKLEIDFVLEADNRIRPVEVTASRAPSGRKLSAVRAAAKAIGATGAILVYGGLGRETRENVTLLPLVDLLLNPEEVLDE